MFVVDGVKNVPVSPSERTCDAFDCVYDPSAEKVSIGTTVNYRNVTLSVLNLNRPMILFSINIKFWRKVINKVRLRQLLGMRNEEFRYFGILNPSN